VHQSKEGTTVNQRLSYHPATRIVKDETKNHPQEVFLGMVELLLGMVLELL